MPHCNPIRQELADLQAEKRALQADLAQASGNMKWGILRQIAGLATLILTKQQELNACLREHNGCQPLSTIFNCTATLTTTHPSAPGPYMNTLALGVWFDCARTQLLITSFPPITVGPFPTPIGSNTTVITMNGGGVGSFDVHTGAIAIPLSLFFDQTIDLPLLIEDSTLPIMLGTGNAGSLTGSPFNPATRAATLVGTGVFNDGILGGFRADLVVAGSFVDQP